MALELLGFFSSFEWDIWNQLARRAERDLKICDLPRLLVVHKPMDESIVSEFFLRCLGSHLICLLIGLGCKILGFRLALRRFKYLLWPVWSGPSGTVQYV